MRAGIAVVVTMASVLVGCGDAAVTEPEATKGDFEGRRAEAFAGAKEFCEMKPRSEFAVSEGLSATSSVTAIARAYASEWPRRLRTAAYAGCKAGLANVPVRFPASIPASEEIWGRNFIAIEATGDDGGPPLIRPLYIRLFFSGEREHAIGWQARCNGFGGDVRFTATEMKVDQVSTTLVGCVPEIKREDEWLAEFLEANPEWRLDGERLTLEAADATVELRGFEDPKACPILPAGGRVELGSSGFDCEGALNLVALHLEGKGRYLQGWSCRERKSADGRLSVVCRRGEARLAAHGFDLAAYQRRYGLEG